MSHTEHKSALVVIDMMHAALRTAAVATAADDRAAARTEVDFVFRRVCSLVERARRDGTQVVFVHQPADAEGPDGWRLIDALQPRFPDWVIPQAGDSVFTGNNLAAQLRAVGVTQLILAGGSIASSSQDALALGFDIVPATDAHLGFPQAGRTVPAAIPARVATAPVFACA